MPAGRLDYDEGRAADRLLQASKLTLFAQEIIDSPPVTNAFLVSLERRSPSSAWLRRRRVARALETHLECRRSAAPIHHGSARDGRSPVDCSLQKFRTRIHTRATQKRTRFLTKRLESAVLA